MFAKVAPHRGETSHNFTDVQILAGTVLVSLCAHHSQNRIVEEESAERFGLACLSPSLDLLADCMFFLQTC